MSWQKESKNTSTWSTDNVIGEPWLYDELDLEYDMTDLNYNYWGIQVVWSKLSQTLKSFLLQEDTYNLLLEDGGKIIVEPQTGVNWSHQVKN